MFYILVDKEEEPIITVILNHIQKTPEHVGCNRTLVEFVIL